MRVCEGVHPPATRGRRGTPRPPQARPGAAPSPHPRTPPPPFPQSRFTSPVHRPDPDGNFHLGVRHLSPLPSSPLPGAADRPRSAAAAVRGLAAPRTATRRRANVHAGPGRGRGTGAGGEGERGGEGGRGGGSGSGEGGGGAPQPPPCSAAVHTSSGAGCRRPLLHNRCCSCRCRRRLPANPSRHLPPPPAAPPGLRRPGKRRGGGERRRRRRRRGTETPERLR